MDCQEKMCLRLSSRMIKHMFGEKARDPALLAMVNAIFERDGLEKLKSLKLIPVVHDGFDKPDHIMRLEMICIGESGTKFDVKLQFMTNMEVATQSFMFWPLMMANWDENGEKIYADRIVAVNFMPGEMDDHERFFGSYRLTNVNDLKESLDYTTLITIELGKYVKQYKESEAVSEFDKWCMFFSGVAQEEKLIDLAKSDPEFASILASEKKFLAMNG